MQADSVLTGLAIRRGLDKVVKQLQKHFVVPADADTTVKGSTLAGFSVSELQWTGSAAVFCCQSPAGTPYKSGTKHGRCAARL